MSSTRALGGVVVAAVLATLAAPTPAAAQSLTLEQAVALAVARNERTQAAEQRRAAASARVAKARSFFFPDITVVGSYTRRAHETTRNVGGTEVTIQSANALQASATLALTIFDARSLPLYRQAKLERDAADSSARDTRRLVAYEAADAFMQTLAEEQVRAATQHRLTFARQRLVDATARQQAQLVSSNDVTRAQLEVATAERDDVRAATAVRRARLELGFLLGRVVDGALVAPATAAPVTGDVRSAKARRWDLAAAIQRTAALRESAREPARRFIPSLGLVGQYRVTNEAGLSGNNTDWSVSLNLVWQVWDGGERAADGRERRALTRIAELDAELLGRRVGLELDSAVLAVENGQAAVQLATTAVDVARKNADETAELYRQGLTTSAVVADAGISLVEAEIELARERYALAVAELDRRHALGLDPTETP